MTIKIYYPEGQAPYTRNVQLCDADSHIAANDRWHVEARALREFSEGAEIPEYLMERELTLVNDTGEYAEYERTSALVSEAEDRLDAKWNGERLAYYDEAMSKWYICEDRDELIDLAKLMRSDDQDISRDAYSHWCAGTSHHEIDLRSIYVITTESGREWLIEQADDEADAISQYVAGESEAYTSIRQADDVDTRAVSAQAGSGVVTIESHWYASYVDGKPPHCRRLNRLSTPTQWAAAIELSIAFARGDAGYRHISRTLRVAGMTIEEGYWYWPACKWGERGDTGWWLIPRRVERRAINLVNAATHCELRRHGGQCDNEDVVTRLRKWRRSKHWQRVIGWVGRRSQGSLLYRREREQRDENPADRGYLFWYRKYLAPRRRRAARRVRRVA